MTRLPCGPRFQRRSGGDWKLRDETSPLLCNPHSHVKSEKYVFSSRSAENEILLFIDDVSDQLLKVQLDSEKRELERTRTESAVEILSKIVGVTTRLFGEDVRVYESFDPEYPEDTFTVFSVQSEQPVEELCQAEQEWVRSLATIAPACDSIRLELCPR